MIRITNRDESLGKHGMSTGKRTATTRCVPLVLLLLIVFMAGSAGCIKVVQTTLSGGAAGNANGAPFVTEPPTSVVTPIDIPQSTPTPIPAAVQTPNQSTVITEVTPFVTPNPYVFPQAVQINESPQYFLPLPAAGVYQNIYVDRQRERVRSPGKCGEGPVVYCIYGQSQV